MTVRDTVIRPELIARESIWGGTNRSPYWGALGTGVGCAP